MSSTNHTCWLCGRDPRPWHVVPRDWRRPALEHSYQLYHCDDCELGYVAPRPTREEVAGFYRVSDYYAHQVESRGAQDLSPFEKVLMHLAWRADHGMEMDDAWLRRHVGLERRRILDIGCGNGEILEMCRKLGHDVTGVEPDPDARRVCATRELAVHDGNAESLPAALRGERFDVLIMTHVLEHTIDPVAALGMARSMLADEGLLIVEVPNQAAKGFAHAGIAWLWLDVPRHLAFFNAKSLFSMLNNAGFRVEALQYRGYQRQFLPTWRNEEKLAWDVFRKSGIEVLPERPSLRAAYKLFLATVSASDSEKYDSVRMLARRSAA